jgi:glycosyltransferase involved in cell wall biosynthesis
MRILHIITGLNNGGAEAVLCRLITSDNGNIHQVISLIDSGIYGAHLIAEGIPTHTINMPSGRVTLKGLIRLYQLIRASNADVVQTWMYHADLIGGIIAKLAGKRVVVWGVRASDAHSHSSDLSSYIILWLSARFSKIVPARIIFASQAGKQIHNDMGYSCHKSVVISNGYSITEFLPDSVKREKLRADWGCSRGTVLIGMVGRWDPLKDHETLFLALSYLNGLINQNWFCILIGPNMTDANAELVALLDRYCLADRVMLCGSRRDIPAVMNALDVHVLSSKSEAFPNVVAEAMACGTPCVVTDVGDVKLIVGGTGWVVPPSDSYALAQALKEAIDEIHNTVKWQARKESCRSRILESYSLDRMVDAYNKVWTDLFYA